MPDRLSRPASRLARLRAGTRDAHARIETVPALARLLAANLTTGEYVAVLRQMQSFLAACEPALAAALAAHPAAAAMLDGSRLQALAEDLAWFGANPLPLAETLPSWRNREAALGGLYVIEGSGLGARVIARHLADTLGVTAGAGASFYDGLSADAARARWQRLCALLEAPRLDMPGPPAADDVAAEQAPADDNGAADADDGLVAGAVATFRCLERWMRRIDVVDGRCQPYTAAVAA